MSLPTILGSGEGESVQIGGSVCTFKATGKDTRGHAGLFEFTMPPGAGASPHIHKELTEMFYVTEGKVELLLADKKVNASQVADKKVNASQGAFMLVPESTPHGFTNIGNSQATLLIMFCPADSREGFFKGMAELTKNGRAHQRRKEELIDLMARYDQYLVPDPTDQ